MDRIAFDQLCRVRIPRITNFDTFWSYTVKMTPILVTLKNFSKEEQIFQVRRLSAILNISKKKYIISVCEFLKKIFVFLKTYIENYNIKL